MNASKKRIGKGHRHHARAEVFAVAVTVIVGLASSAALAGMPSASHGDGVGTELAPGLSVHDDGWITFPSVLEQVGRAGEVFRIRGEVTDGTCTLSGTFTANRGDDTTYFTEEVAYNPATCEADYMRAAVDQQQIAAIDAVLGRGQQHDASLAPKAGSGNGGDVSALAATTYSRYLRTAWIDPINIEITYQRVAMKWTSTTLVGKSDSSAGWGLCFGGTCFDKTSLLSTSRATTTRTTGWTYRADSHLRNTSFAKYVVAVIGLTGWAACGFPTSFTADFYHSGSVTGNKAGSSSWSWSDSKSGACTNLVHHGDTTGASYP